MKKNDNIIKKILFFFILVLTLSLSTIACSYKKLPEQKNINEEKKENETANIKEYDFNVLRIAVIASKTGKFKSFGEDAYRIAEIIRDEINKKGGVLNKKIEIIELDSESSSLTAKKCAENAVRLNVSAVIGDIISSNSLAIAPVLQEAGIPMISPASTNPELTLIGDYIFRVCYTDHMQAIAIASFAINDLKAKSAIILTNAEYKYSSSLSDHFRNHFVYSGGKILKEINYLFDITNADAIIADIKSLKPDVIFIPGYAMDSINLIKAIKNSGINTFILGGDGWGSDIVNYVQKNELANCYNVSHWHPDLMNYKPDIFVKYEKKYNKITKSLIPLTYDSFFILFDAIKRAGSIDRLLFREEIAKTAGFNGLTGNITFDHNGDTLKEIIIQRYENNRILFVKKIKIDTLRIGAIFAKTGDAAVGNLNALEGVRFAVDELNSGSGIKGKYVELLEYNNESSSIISRKAAEKAAANNVIAVIGASWSAHSLSIAPVLQKAGIPMITPSSTSPDITKVGDYIFRVCYIDTFQGSAMAKFAYNDLKKRKAVILINTNSKYSIDLGSFFSKQFKELGGSILWEGEYLETSTDFMNLVEKIKGLDCEVIFLPGYYKDSALIIKQLKKNGIKSVFLGGDSWNEKMFSIGDEYINGSYFSSYWHRDMNNKENIDFISKFEKRFGRIKSNQTALAYDAVNILAYAVNHTDVITKENIKNALLNIKDFNGASGKITYRKNGDPERTAVILKFEENKIKFIKTIY